MNWKVEYTDAAVSDLMALDNSRRLSVRKAIDKVSRNPLPVSEGGYGKPLGNRHGKDLTGLCKIKLLREGIRIVYRVVRENNVMKIVVIAARADDEVYALADQRTAKKP